jgi:mono/diheme cytochrome c family protein
MECHGARNALGALSGSDEGPGGLLPGSLWLAPALSDPAGASVAAWSEAEIAAFLQTGRNGSAQASGPMAEVVLHSTQYLTDADALAMARYLRALPQRPAAPLAPAPKATTAGNSKPMPGVLLYEKHCADCHGAQGQGRANAYPALAGNRAVNQALPNNLIHSLMNGGFGPATHGNPLPFGMPPFQLQLGDADMAALLSHIRSAWGNHAAPVSEFDINKFRRAQAR